MHSRSEIDLRDRPLSVTQSTGSGCLACQSNELIEVLPKTCKSALTEHVRQGELGIASSVKRRTLKRSAQGCELDNARPSVIGIDDTLQVASPLEVADELIHGLLRDLHIIRDLCRPLTLQSGIPKHGDVGLIEVLETRSANL